MESKRNYFVRVLTVFLCCLLGVMIFFNFFRTDPKGDINAGLITLLGFLIIVILSESFDSFSLGKILSLSRDNKKKETTVSQLSHENSKLREQIINIATSVTQNQSSTNIFGASDELMKNFSVQQATEEEIAAKDTTEEDSEERVSPTRRLNRRKLEEVSLVKFIKENELSSFNLIKEAKLVSQFQGIDPVSNIHPIYDGYINTGDSEIFIEVRPLRRSLFMSRERIYLMANKIHLYNLVKKANARLVLLFADTREGDIGRRNPIDRLGEDFYPAITSGLLRIIKLDLTDDEINAVMDEE
jgi:hypothetical protein